MKILIQLAFITLLFSTHTFAQQFNNGIINATTTKVYQPASIIGDYNVSINVLSVSGSLVNNGYSFTKEFILSSEINSAAEGKDFFKNQDNVLKSAAANIDIIGPSVSYKLNDGSYVGAYTRFREVVNFDRLNNGVFQVFNSLDHKFWGRTFSQHNFNFSVHTFNEIGINYGKQICSENGHSLALGGTIKLLSGISSATIQVGELNLNITPDSINQLNGTFRVAYSEKAGSLTNAIVTTPARILNISGPKSIGADMGLSYEYKGSNDNNYIIKASLAITDIGKIKYATSKNSKQYYVNAKKENIDVIGFKEKQTPAQYFNQLKTNGVIDSEKPINNLIMKLPTSLRGNIDYNVVSKFYLNTDFLINISKGNSVYSNTISIMPSYRSKWYSISVPVTANKISSTGIGAYIQVGPLLVGSSSIISNMAKDKINSVDMYAALSWCF